MIIWGEAIPVLGRFGVTEPDLLMLAEKRLKDWKCKRNPLANAFPDYVIAHVAVHTFLDFKGVGASYFTSYLAFTRELLPMMRSFYAPETKNQCIREITAKWVKSGCDVSLLESIADLTWQLRALDKPVLDYGAVGPTQPAN